MVPTLVGISLIVFVIMVAAPGRPGEKAQAFGEVNADDRPDEGEEQGRVPAPLPPAVRARPARVLEPMDLALRRGGPRRRRDRRRPPGRRRDEVEARGEGAARGLGLLRRPRARAPAEVVRGRRPGSRPLLAAVQRDAPAGPAVRPQARRGDHGAQCRVAGRERRARPVGLGALGRRAAPGGGRRPLERLVREERRRGGSGAAARSSRSGSGTPSSGPTGPTSCASTSGSATSTSGRCSR